MTTIDSKNYASSIKPPSAEMASYPAGASSPSQAALITQKNNNATQTNLAKLGGRSRRSKSKRSRKYGGDVTIYSPTLNYPEAGSGNNTITAINKSATNTLVQNTANAQYDTNAKKGGSRRRKSVKNYLTRINWGCYSGGRNKRKTKKSRRSRKSRK
jgi:hypothetical protein